MAQKILLIVGIVMVVLTHQREFVRKPERPSLVPPKELKHFSLGYNEVLADSIWIRVLQDLDFCETGKAQPVPKVRQEDLIAGTHDWAPAACQNGWVFSLLDSVTELAPKFSAPYDYGAVALSVLVADRSGATMLFEKGVKQFPNNVQLAMMASYHMLFEEKNPKRAAELLIQAGNSGAPPWVFSLASRIYEKNGQVAFARQILNSARAIAKDERDIERIEQRLKDIEAGDAVGAGSAPSEAK